MSKTKELVIDFRKKCTKLISSTIHGKDIEIVDMYKNVGTVFDSQLKFDANTECIVRSKKNSLTEEVKLLKCL